MESRNARPRKGSGCVVGPANRAAEPSREMSGVEADCAVPADAVALFAPWANDTERALRLRIHKARDIATARASRSTHRRARLIYSVASELASEWVFRRANMEDLEQVLRALSQSFLAAGNIQTVEAPDEW